MRSLVYKNTHTKRTRLAVYCGLYRAFGVCKKSFLLNPNSRCESAGLRAMDEAGVAGASHGAKQREAASQSAKALCAFHFTFPKSERHYRYLRDISRDHPRPRAPPRMPHAIPSPRLLSPVFSAWHLSHFRSSLESPGRRCRETPHIQQKLLIAPHHVYAPFSGIME